MAESQDVEFIRLLDWVDGRLSEEEARAVEEQLAAADRGKSDLGEIIYANGPEHLATS
jgi:anti-sigma factor RsiW